MKLFKSKKSDLPTRCLLNDEIKYLKLTGENPEQLKKLIIRYFALKAAFTCDAAAYEIFKTLEGAANEK